MEETPAGPDQGNSKELADGDTGQDSSALTMSLPTPPSLSPVPSWPCKSLWELAVALHAPATSTLIPAPLSTQGAGVTLPPPESPPYLQTGLTLLPCSDNFESFLFYLLTFSSQVEKNSSNFLSLSIYRHLYLFIINFFAQNFLYFPSLWQLYSGN